MIPPFLKKYAGIAALACLAAGCASTPSRFYTLNSQAKPAELPPLALSLIVGPVTVPAMVDHPQFTVQVSPNRVVQDEFDRWAEPLNDNIARVLVADLGSLLGTAQVAKAPTAQFGPAYQVAINVQRFDSFLGKSAELDALWVIHQPTGTNHFFGRTVVSEPVTGKDYEALAAAHSRALAKLSSDIAARIRREVPARP